MVSKFFEHPSHSSTPEPYPLAYFITFTCYGTFLHGDERTSVDRHHSGFDTPPVPPNTSRVQAIRKQLKQEPYRLDQKRRLIVLEALKETCRGQQWWLFAAHVRSNHVHVVVQAETEPETILGRLKARASQQLTRCGIDLAGRRRWTRHGSTKYLWQEEAVGTVIEYVVERQGEKMAVYEGELPDNLRRARGLKPTALFDPR